MGVKTYKRELAVAMLLVLYGFGLGAASGSPQSLEVLRILSVPTFLAVGGAFGIHAFAQQLRSPQ